MALTLLSLGTDLETTAPLPIIFSSSQCRGEVGVTVHPDTKDHFTSPQQNKEKEKRKDIQKYKNVDIFLSYS